MKAGSYQNQAPLPNSPMLNESLGSMAVLCKKGASLARKASPYNVIPAPARANTRDGMYRTIRPSPDTADTKKIHESAELALFGINSEASSHHYFRRVYLASII